MITCRHFGTSSFDMLEFEMCFPLSEVFISFFIGTLLCGCDPKTKQKNVIMMVFVMKSRQNSWVSFSFVITVEPSQSEVAFIFFI